MEPKDIKSKIRPEAKIQNEMIMYLRGRSWIVKPTHGNAYQSGFPDLYAAHIRYGARWIEMKHDEAYSFTPAQREFFPLLSSVGIGVWVLVAATEEEYLKLWQPANWYQYLEVQKIVSRPRPSLSKIEGYVPKYPIKENK